MTPSQFEVVHRGGKQVLRLRPAWASYWGSFLGAVGVFVLWLMQKQIIDGLMSEFGVPAALSILGLIVPLLLIFTPAFYHRYTHSYEIENGNKLRLIEGFISRVKREFPLTDKVQTDMGQTLIGRILNYGSLAFWTGDDRSRLNWTNVADPDRVIAYIDQMKSGNQPGAEASPKGAVETISTSLPAPPSLKQAKSSKLTHFGSADEFKPISERVAKRIKTPLGTYIDNDDGTVTDEWSGLMWLRAPWGMVWTGNGFAGEPLVLNWRTAVDLFGRGTVVGYNVGSTKAYMNHEKRAASAFESGFERGRCTVQAAGFRDWRLPTAAELDRFSPYLHGNSMDLTEYPHEFSKDQYEWRWREPAAVAVFKRLYPEIRSTRPHLWTATGAGGGIAWAYDGGLPVGDFKTNEERSVIFVRKLTGGEPKPGKVEDENIAFESI
jgi:hypothetical protein